MGADESLFLGKCNLSVGYRNGDSGVVDKGEVGIVGSLFYNVFLSDFDFDVGGTGLVLATDLEGGCGVHQQVSA